ncbi:cytochrome P450 [Guyanagaster necrorhizus]|uniref:Cytochrome P450 n=1 Tax=Guyanagaster necrorhizus TaxID=856835 RepID=A0A9P7VIH6_9AGAR|nr:cytochrome P450 [Guyanagaster necrorhizus MCA 3950]KAG7441676.1 cytochrome P450 [Guyanagaster necrorhizus MCA 3950]
MALLSVANFLALGAFAWVFISLLRGTRSGPIPPGPRRLPIIGNLLDMPTEREWVTWAEWGKRYGGISSATVLGQTIIVLNSYNVAKELLNNRSARYSDRPPMSMHILSGWGDIVLVLGYGSAFRAQRKLFHKLLGTMENLQRFYYIEDEQTRKFLKDVLRDPDHWVDHVHDDVASIVLRIAYGYTISKNDPLVAKCRQITAEFLQMASPKFLVNKLPALRHLPDWIPGAGFKRLAKRWNANVQEMTLQPFNWVKDQMAKGTAEYSYVSSNLEDGEDEFAIKWTASTIQTVISIKTFFKAMTMFPEIQHRVQAEIDSVTGGERLPTLADRDEGRLPYTLAALQEVFRWHSPIPTGFPHRTMEDDTYNGYFIPKGSIVIYNIWQMSRDPEFYPHPDVFDPTRFLGPSPQLDPREVTFGFGRRICPGQHLAEASIFLTVARSLAAFNITKARDENGVIQEPVPGQVSGVLSDTLPFNCVIKPRSEKAVHLVNEAF